MENILSQYYRYIIAGFIVTACDFVILTTGTEVFHIYYLISACFSFVLCSILHYIISIKYIFHSRCFDNACHEFTVFLLIGIISLVIFELLMFSFTELMQIHYLISKVIVTGIMFTFNFISRKLILFR